MERLYRCPIAAAILDGHTLHWNAFVLYLGKPVFSFLRFLSFFWLLYSFTLNPRSGIVSPNNVERLVDLPFAPGTEPPTTGSRPETNDFKSFERLAVSFLTVSFGSQAGGLSFCTLSQRGSSKT
jgi:hypothetical protein